MIRSFARLCIALTRRGASNVNEYTTSKKIFTEKRFIV